MSFGKYKRWPSLMMGSGASSNKNNVQPIVIKQTDERLEERSNLKKLKSKNQEFEELSEKYKKCKLSLKKAEERVNKSAKHVTELEKQVAILESTNLDLKDHIQVLEERLDQAYRKNVITEEKSCEGTLLAKDQYISKLETETKRVQKEIAKLRAKTKKKLQSLHAQLAETKQESSLKMFEMKDEVAKLTEENRRLLETKGEAAAPMPEECETNAEVESGRTKIILQLSQQISEQNDKINELEHTLKEKESTIRNLRGDRERGSQITTPLTPPADNQKQSRIVALPSSPSSSPGGTGKNSPQDLTLFNNSDTQNLFNRVSSEMDELKAIAQEMQQLKKKKKKGQVKSSEEADENNGSETVSRQWSSTSRDSGYGCPTGNGRLESGKSSARRRRRDRFGEQPLSRMVSANSSVSAVTDSEIMLDSLQQRVSSGKSYLSDVSEYTSIESDLDGLVDYNITRTSKMDSPRKYEVKEPKG